MSPSPRRTRAADIARSCPLYARAEACGEWPPWGNCCEWRYRPRNRRPDQGFCRFRRGALGQSARRARQHSRHDRPERRRQNHLLQSFEQISQPRRAGRIVFDGRDITALRPADVARLGLVRSFQISAVFPHLTVLENVRIALQRRRGGSFDFWRSQARAACARRARHGADRRCRTVALCQCAGGRIALWPQARAGNRNHAGARSGNCCCSTSRPRAWATTTSTASAR